MFLGDFKPSKGRSLKACARVRRGRAGSCCLRLLYAREVEESNLRRLKKIASLAFD